MERVLRIIAERLERIEALELIAIRLENTLIILERKIMTALSDLQDAVAAEAVVEASAITLLNGLKAALDAAIASGDPAALTALSADIGTRTAALAAAVAADTPVDPNAPPPAGP